ncbi:MAG: lysophospholipase [Cyanobacteria bacterium J06641_5]
MLHHEGWLIGKNGSSNHHLYYQWWAADTVFEPARGVLVLVHGHSGHSDRFENVAKVLVPLGYRVFGFDLRGHGRSTGRRGHVSNWDEFRADLAFVLEWVTEQWPNSPRFLCGHSMGGTIVLDYVLRSPQGLQGAIAIAPVLGAIGVPAWKLALARLLSRCWPTFTLATSIDTSTATRDPAVNAAYAADPLRHGRGSARLATELSTAVAGIWQRVEDWQLPLLLLHGSSDRVTASANSLAFFERIPYPDKELREYPGAYHELYADLNRQEVLANIVDWLGQHLTDRRTGDRHEERTITLETPSTPILQ